MNEKNFDSISQFEVPKSWIDDALNIPQNKVKKPFPLIKFSRNLMAVACFILVCGISVALYFITDDSSIPPVKPPVSSHSANTECMTEDSNKYESNIINSENKDKDEQIHSATQSPFVQSSHPERSEDETVVSTQAHQNPDKKPTDKPNKKPEQNNQDNPIQTDALEPPEEKPTQGEGDKPVDPYPPVEKPSEVILPTYPPAPTENPTYTPAYTENPTEAPEPTEETIYVPPWVSPTIKPTQPESTEAPTINFKYVLIQGVVDNSKLTGSKNVYCKLYDKNGNLLGDPNLFSSSHLTVKAGSGTNKTTVWYYVYRNININVSSTYTYVFYNENGDALKSGTTYLKANV